MRHLICCEFLPEHPSRMWVGVKFVAFLMMALVAFTPVNETLSVEVVLAQTEEIDLGTETWFSTEVIEQREVLAFESRTELDDARDKCDEEEVVQAGENGSQTKRVVVTYYDGEEYDREVLATEVVEPVDEIRIKGTQKIYKTMETDAGTIRYWCKLGIFEATAYDPTCLGCNGTTAVGMRAGFGVVAVDPKVIPLRSELYITGYGKAVAGDTGGAIKGKRVDLGFDSIGKWWGRRSVEVYLL